MKVLFQLVREILHLSGKSQGISETSGGGRNFKDAHAQEGRKRLEAFSPNPGYQRVYSRVRRGASLPKRVRPKAKDTSKT